MRPTNSPLNHLSAFAIVFAAGFLTATSLTLYIGRVRRNAVRDHFQQFEREAEFSFHSPTRRSHIDDIPMPTLPVQPR